MNIKSLLLGSAAALAAVSGARAADAVMAEPEAVEYVRVCDAYGAGYFYIPGTETCLKIGGYVRYQIDYVDGDNGWVKLARAQLEFTAKSDTELGTLTSFIDMRANNIDAPTKGAFGAQEAWISLGGLKMGFTDTLWDGDINGEFDEFGGDLIHFIGYTFSAGNGLSFTLNLEEENFDADYVPNVVAKLSYEQGMFGVKLWAAYDDEDGGAVIVDTSEFALKAILTAKVSDPFTLQLGATYSSGPSYYSNGYDWSIAASGKYKVNDKLAITLGGQYLSNLHGFSNDDFAIGTVIDYTIVKDFTAKLAVNYRDGDSFSSGGFDGFLRFQRSF
jgi:opacity protein-like surface antigen